MKDIKQRTEKLRVDAEDCALISKLATIPEKRDALQKLGSDYRKMARELETIVVNKVIPDREQKSENLRNCLST